MNLQKLVKEVLDEQKVKRDRCLRIADRKFDKPSAYKSGAVVRCRQGDIWKGIKENTHTVTEIYDQNIINQIFQSNSELASVGTPQQYSQYLDTIFPSSKVKDIVYHGTNANDIEGGRLRLSKEGVYGEGIYVQTNKEFTGTFGSNTLSLVIDTKKPFSFYDNDGKPNKLWLTIRDKYANTKKFYWADIAKEEFRDEIKKLGYDSIKTEEGGGNAYYILFDPEQTYILGSKQDIEGFKKSINRLTEAEKETLRGWFKRSGPKGKEGGWVDCNAPDGKGGYKACGRKKGEKRAKYPSCRPTPSACKQPGKGKKWGKTK
jgi:hypothetical protein